MTKMTSEGHILMPPSEAMLSLPEARSLPIEFSFPSRRSAFAELSHTIFNAPEEIYG